MKQFYIDGINLKVNDIPTLAAVMGGAEFVLSDGMHELVEPLKISGVPVKLTAAEGVSPVISAAREIRGFSSHSVNGVTVWVAPVPEECLGANQAFTPDGRRVPRPRLPKDGFYLVSGIPGFDEPFKTDRNTRSPGINFLDGELPKLRYPQDVDIRAFHWWTDELLKIREIDYDAHVITFVDPSISSMRCENSETHGARWYADNVFEALGQAEGQYYLDRAEALIYYVPTPEDDIDSFSLCLPALTSLLEVRGAMGSEELPALEVENIAFACSDWEYRERLHSQSASDTPSSIYVADSKHVIFRGCAFRNIGFSAICIDTGAACVTFDHCSFTDIGGNAINIAGNNGDPHTNHLYPEWNNRDYKHWGNPNDDKFGIIHDVKITDCLIRSYGRVFFNACGILLRYAHHCEISHNEISDGYYTGISVGWIWGYTHSETHHIRIEKNHIYNIGQTLLSDMGGIYTLGRQPGTVISGNLIHDVEMDSYGGWCIYPDEGSSDMLIENNVCYRCTAQPFHQHYGQGNLVRNNIFAFGEGGQMIVTRYEQHLSIILERNILVSKGTALYAKPAEGLHIADSGNLLWNYDGEAVSGSMNFNVMTREYSFPEENRRTPEQMRAGGLYRGAKIADPLFADPENGDFTLAPDSPAFDIDFIPIDLSDVGIRN
ncbi:MAG: hypothetical protein GX628_07380 [Clostridiales bacterium]|nr:hypothetical protein [Clostridiales bacterium]